MLHCNKLQLAAKWSFHCWGHATFLGQHLKDKQLLSISVQYTWIQWVVTFPSPPLKLPLYLLILTCIESARIATRYFLIWNTPCISYVLLVAMLFSVLHLDNTEADRKQKLRIAKEVLSDETF